MPQTGSVLVNGTAYKVGVCDFCGLGEATIWTCKTCDHVYCYSCKEPGLKWSNLFCPECLGLWRRA
jgi:hypothetical protein